MKGNPTGQQWLNLGAWPNGRPSRPQRARRGRKRKRKRSPAFRPTGRIRASSRGNTDGRAVASKAEGPRKDRSLEREGNGRRSDEMRRALPERSTRSALSAGRSGGRALKVGGATRIRYPISSHPRERSRLQSTLATEKWKGIGGLRSRRWS